MSEKPDLADRIGMAINELDIDFSRFSIVGWVVSVLSVSIGGAIAFAAGQWMVNRNGLDKAAGLVFCFTLIGVTTVVFISLRSLTKRFGMQITNPRTTSSFSNQKTLQRMEDAGMNMSVEHTFSFWHRFPNRKNAEDMSREAKELGFHVGPIESNHENRYYDVHVRKQLIPTLNMVNQTEQTLAVVAERNGGRADGWGTQQRG